MLAVGDLAPDFSLPADDGRTVSLGEMLSGGPVALFFYPKALTSGCTKEGRHFRDLGSEFAALGAQRLGIGADPPARQHAFSDRHGFDYPLVSDVDRSVARAYGVKRPGPLFNRRATFVIGTDRRLLGVIRSEIDMDRHADQALEVLRAR